MFMKNLSYSKKHWIFFLDSLEAALLDRSGNQPRYHLEKNVELLDEMFLSNICGDASILGSFTQDDPHILTMLEFIRKTHPRLNAFLQSNHTKLLLSSAFAMFAYTVFDLSVGDPEINIEVCIAMLHHVLKINAYPSEEASFLVFLSLGDAFCKRTKGDFSSNVESSILSYKKALAFYKRDSAPEVWANIMNNIGSRYVYRIAGDPIINRRMAIFCCTKSLEVFDENETIDEWLSAKHNLAAAYTYDQCKYSAGWIEKSIVIYKEIIEIAEKKKKYVAWADAQNNLSVSYRHRVYGNQHLNLDLAIASIQKALKYRTKKEKPLDWAMSTFNLGSTYLDFFNDNLNPEEAESYINSAVQHLKEVFSVYTPDRTPIEWGRAMNALGLAYSSNPEESIKCFNKALLVLRLDSLPIEWAETMTNLASLYTRSKCIEEIKLGIFCYDYTLQVYNKKVAPFQWAKTMFNLGATYKDLVFDHNENEAYWAAIVCYRDALTILAPNFYPQYCYKSARSLASIYVMGNEWGMASEVYDIALTANYAIFISSLTLANMEYTLIDSSAVYRRACYAHAKNGNLKKAVTVIENGLVQKMSRDLALYHSDLSKLESDEPSIHARYIEAITLLSDLQQKERADIKISNKSKDTMSLEGYINHSYKVQQASKKLDQLINEISTIDGYENFLASLNLQGIERSVNLESPLVYLSPSGSGGVAIFLFRTSEDSPVCIKSIFIDSMSDQEISSIVTSCNDKHSVSYNDAFLRFRENQVNDPIALTDWIATNDELCRKLWEIGMKDVVAQLEHMDIRHAILIPTGSLRYLPLHAAWTEDSNAVSGRRYASDQITFSYIQNAQTLQHTRQTVQSLSGDKQTFLAIQDPQPVIGDNLIYSAHEVAVASAHFPAPQIIADKEATKEAILEAFSCADVIHLSCHGRAELKEPLESHVLVANDEKITLKDILALQSQGIRLAVLSACESGIPGTDLPDEVISLPSGLLQAGVAGVIASQWVVDDLSTAILMARFYDCWRNEEMEPAVALNKAQIWLRDTSNEEKQIYFDEASTQDVTYPLAKKSAEYFFNAIAELEHEYSHPYYWAGFTFTGV